MGATMIFSILLMVVAAVSGDASKEVFIRRLKSKMATQDFKSPEALVRRLQLSSLPQACTDACPAIVDYEQAMMMKMMQSMGSGGSDFESMDIGGMMADIFGGLCTHKTALKCVSNNLDACAMEETSSEMSIDSLAAVVDCFCDACPGSGQAYGAFVGEMMTMMTSMMSGDGQQVSQSEEAAMMDKMMTLSCMMVGANECFAQNPDSCAAALGAENETSLMDMMGGDDMMGAENETIVEMCEQMGKSTDYSKMDYSKMAGSGEENSSAASLLVGAGLAAMLAALF